MHTIRHSEYRACLAIRNTPYIGPRSWKKLLSHYGAARPALDDAARWHEKGLVQRRGMLEFTAGAYRHAARMEYDTARALGLHVLLWTDPQYPERLRNIPDPPLFLYYAGRLDLLDGPSIAVVGSRKCTSQGIALTQKICTGLTETGITIISGMALGIDRHAHLAGLAGPGSSIAVLGTGLDRLYPRGNADVRDRLLKNGLILSEFAPGTTPDAKNFPYRNRIVSGLSLGVVVTEATLRSGSRITARLALEQGREVYTVQGKADNDREDTDNKTTDNKTTDNKTFEGCHNLIEQGAREICSAGEVLLDLAVLIKDDVSRVLAKAKQQKQPDADSSTPDAPPTSPAPLIPSIPFTSGTPNIPAHKPSKTNPPTPPLPAHITPDEQAILQSLARQQPLHIDELSRRLDWDPARSSRMLLQLELHGLIQQLPGMHYCLSDTPSQTQDKQQG